MPRKREKPVQGTTSLPPYRPKSGGSPVLVTVVAKATKTSPQVLAALRGAYGWDDKTQLTRAEFIQKRDAWLKRPASEV